MLLSHKLKIYTDHNNLTYKNFNTNKVLRWILILEEYSMYIEYIQGEKKYPQMRYHDYLITVIKRQPMRQRIQKKLCPVSYIF